jgi:hypothetical protein
MTPYKFSPLQLLWIAALKSGKFRQGTGQLAERKSKHVNYCCLGVACALTNKMAGKLGLEKLEKAFITDEAITFDGSQYRLPFALVAPLRLRDDKGVLAKPVKDNEGEYAETLADLNDMAGWTFKQIAEYIEKNPRNVFVS